MTGPTGATGATAVYFSNSTTVSDPAITNPKMVAGTVSVINGNTTVTFTGSSVFSSATSYACTVTNTARLGGTTQSVVTTQTANSITINTGAAATARYICVGN